ncbi:MAG: glycosyltransferase [Acetobacteraceae bacterium]|nr:glycosyltransferase [Acetobacteraceae bacterium]
MTAPAPLLLHVFSTFAVGGPQQRFVTLATAFGTRYRHIVVAMDANLACAARLPAGLDVRCEPVAATKGAFTSTIRNRRHFRQRLREIAPDALVTYNWGATEWALANIPRLTRHIHVEDGFGPEERDRQLARRMLLRRLALARSTIVVPSRTLWRIATGSWRLDPRRVRYVPNGIDLVRFNGCSPPADEPVIGTVAVLRPEKNLSRLLRAFRLVVDAMPAQLVIAGDGPERGRLQALAAELGLDGTVRFTGHLDDPAALYRGLDVFALASDTEQMPLSVIEAMASGLPIAATAVGDVSAMVAAENQAFVAPLDDAALGAAIMALAQDKALRLRVGAANRAKAEQEFGVETMVATWAALIDGAVIA